MKFAWVFLLKVSANLKSKFFLFVGVLKSDGDLSSEGARSKERYRRAVFTSLALAFARLLSVCTILISVPLTIKYLGAERYGLWITVSSLAITLSFFDLGITNSLINLISHARGKQNVEKIRSHIVNSFFLLSSIGLLIASLFFLTTFYFNPASYFGFSSTSALEEANRSISFFVFLFALSLPLSSIQKVEMALQEGYIAALWQCGASVFGLIVLIVLIHAEAEVPYLIAGQFGASIAANFLNWVHFFGWRHSNFRPSIRILSMEAMSTIVKAGGMFFALQILGILMLASDNLIIAKILGTSAVAQYSIAEKMFSVIAAIIAVVATPLWPAYGDAISRKDNHWVKKTLRRSLQASLFVSTVLSVSLLIFGQWFIKVWTNGAVAVPWILILGMALWKVTESVGSSLSVLLNAASVIRAQLFISSTTAIVAILLKVSLIPIFGVVCVAWITAFVFIIFTLVPYLILMPRILKKIEFNGA